MGESPGEGFCTTLQVMQAMSLSSLQDEFLDVIYWFRQIIAVVLGVIWGVLPLRGFLGIAG